MASSLSSIIDVEREVAEQLSSHEKEFASTQKEHLQARDRLFKRRQELVSGKATPTTDELAGYEPPGDGSHGAAASAKAGVPYFWLNALCNQDTLAEEISSRDRQALAYCTSVKAVHPAAGGPATVEMSFSSNPFFSNNMLRRCLGDVESGAKAVTTDIQWKDNSHDLTVKEVRKGGGGKGKKGGKGKTGSDAAGSSSVRLKPCPSFFRFFLPDSSSSKGSKVPKHLHDPTALHEDDDGDDEEEQGGGEGGVRSAKAERDELLMALLVEQVLPRAADLYLSGPLQTLSDEEEGDFQVVHAGAGSPADLPGPLQGLLAALRHNQAALDALAAQRQQQRDSVTAQEEQLRLDLASKRRKLLVPADGSSTSVPRFWLRVLRSADTQQPSRAWRKQGAAWQARAGVPTQCASGNQLQQASEGLHI
ncbi:nucleosome assembly protein-domain-containing protein [Scenedesmus sp. NREL 46B-D3]|nr:nucleosome assembly protein-domain-containing protein [Scenedesmus sp. NREL 46B-D3]